MAPFLDSSPGAELHNPKTKELPVLIPQYQFSFPGVPLYYWEAYHLMGLRKSTPKARTQEVISCLSAVISAGTSHRPDRVTGNEMLCWQWLSCTLSKAKFCRCNLVVTKAQVPQILTREKMQEFKLRYITPDTIEYPWNNISLSSERTSWYSRAKSSKPSDWQGTLAH